ncbi:putative invertase inhibitor [Magnolia sinica]|uniref:putative invertase inhibitor n=1 Tax=Magnolia sinica TaxID=86752 RepID=UPI00265B6320|nr:putative invertase inhibitor [Magnolia sinica]
MGPNSVFLSLFLLSLTFTILLPLYSSSSLPTQNSTDLISKTCNQTGDYYFNQTAAYDFCVASLESDPRSSSGDVSVFVEILIELASSNVSHTYPYIYQLYNETSEFVMKDRLSVCLKMYESMGRELKEAHYSLSIKNYGGVIDNMGYALDDTVTCAEGFYEPPVRKSPFSQQTSVLEHLCRITLAIDNILVKGSF